MIRRAFSRFLFAVGVIVALLWIGCMIATVLALLTAAIVGVWDLLVWLTKSDWRTTNFDVPIIALAVAAVSWFGCAICGSVTGRIESWSEALDPDQG